MGLWASPRAWAFVGALSTRGAGFVASFSLARFAGATPLALYLATVVAASVVSTPLAQVLFNGGLLSATSAPTAAWARGLFRVVLGMAVLGALPLVLIFVAMHSQVVNEASQLAARDVAWLWVAGVGAVCGQVLTQALTGLLNGLGAQLPTARVTACLSTLLMPLSVPAVWWLGLQGAWIMLLLSSWLPVLVLGALVLRWLQRGWRAVEASGGPDASEAPVAIEADGPAQAMWQQVRSGWPNAVALMAAGAAGWLCSIYLVQRHQGAAGVAVLGVATQWMTLILMPATSWGGVVLRELAEARLRSDARSALGPTLRRLMLRNVLVTLAVAAVVLAASGWLERAYRLDGAGLPALLAVSVLASLVLSANGVLERALITWDRQWALMLISFAGLSAQVACTVIWVERSVQAVQWGLMLSAIVSSGLMLRALARLREGGRA